MIPTGSKLWYGVCAFAAVACVVYFAASGGEEYGAIVLASLAVAAFTLGLLMSLLRDADVDVDGAVATTPAAGTTTGVRPQLAAVWPALAALGGVVVIVGLAVGGILLYVGIGIAVAAGIEWMIQAWAERATPDPATNRDLRNRLMHPVEIPVVAAVVIAGVILAFSRVLLALPKAGSTIIAIVIATLILAVAFLLTSRPKLSSSLLTGAVVVGAVAMLGGGIVGAVAGERDFEHHGEEEHEEGGAPVTALITASNVNDYDEDEVNVPVGEPVLIEFENTQLGVQHNVNPIDLEDVPPTEIITGPDSLTFEVFIEEPGEYEFICDVHPEMSSVFVAVEQPASDEEPEGDHDAGQEEGVGAGVEDLDGEG